MAQRTSDRSYPIAVMIASMFGLGHLPLAPGTWGSASVALVGVLGLLGVDNLPLIFLGLAGVTALIGLITIPVVQQKLGSDPSAIVIDEACGMSLVLALPLATSSGAWLVTAFLLFRLYDIFKPWPANWINRRHEAWAVIGDDVVAALWTVVTMLVVNAALQPLILVLWTR